MATTELVPSRFELLLYLSRVLFQTCSLLTFFLFCLQVSPDHKLVAYAEDTKGDEIYAVHVIDSESLKPVGQPLKGVTCYLQWAGDDALVYVTMDEILRPDKVYICF